MVLTVEMVRYVCCAMYRKEVVGRSRSRLGGRTRRVISWLNTIVHACVVHTIYVGSFALSFVCVFGVNVRDGALMHYEVACQSAWRVLGMTAWLSQLKTKSLAAMSRRGVLGL